MRKRGNAPLIAFVALALGLFITTVILGDTPNLGLDLQGGVSVVLQPVAQGGAKDTSVSQEALDQTKSIIEKRVNAIGVGEPDITIQGKTIVVQLPGIKDQKQALALVGETAELRFRPVLEDLGGGLTKTQQNRIVELRKKLKIPDGVSAIEVYNAEQTARGLPTIPDPATTTTTAPTGATTTPTATTAPPGVTTAPTTTTAPTGSAAPGSTATTTPGDGTGGKSSAKVARVRRQSGTTTSLAPSTSVATTAAPDTAPSTTAAPTTTTTIDPAPKNQYGIKIYKDETGAFTADFQELAGLEQQKATSSTGLTKPADDDPAKEVVLADARGNKYRLGPTLLTGKAVEGAEAGLNQQGEWEVRPTFKSGKDGIDLFNKAAALCNGNQPTCPQLSGREHGALAVVLDSVVLTAPSINNPSYARNQITISGSFTEKEAKNVATALRYGSLPLILEPQQVQTVSATIGKGALRAALIAGAIGLALVAVWMIFYYRLLGLVTISALLLSATMMWTIISFLGQNAGLTLTLAGIVGIIVSIGVSLDSSVVYFENLKEDVRNGRSLRSTVDRSFNTAFATTVKADVSSLIGAVILYLLSVGPVRGFALFLGISTVLDLLTGYFFTRPVVALMGRTQLANTPSKFGIPTDDLPAATRPGAVPSPKVAD